MITIRNSTIRFLGYGLLLLNVIVFFLTWLRWTIGIPAALVLLTAFFFLGRAVYKDPGTIRIPAFYLLIMAGLVLAWVLVSGLGGVFPQKNDLHWRNAILHDLINYPWPVRYHTGFDTSLSYYIAFWMVPALAGKFAAFIGGSQFGWTVANFTSALYAAALLWLVMLLLVSKLQALSLNRMILVATVLILFSGMDIVPTIVGQLGNTNLVISGHLEWWNSVQYSSNSTQLCWVYNQAIPAWLATALLLHEKRLDHYAFLGLLLLPYGPLPFIGLFLLMLAQVPLEVFQAILHQQVPQLLKDIFSWANLLALVTILPVFYFYFSINQATSAYGLDTNPLPLLNYLLLVLFEFLLFALLIARKSYAKRFFLTSVAGLFLIPLMTFGQQQDFCMRASIPLLFVLMVHVCDYLLENINWSASHSIQVRMGALAVLLVFLLGTATPLNEYRESLAQLIQSQQNGTSFIKDSVQTLDREDMYFDNFIAMQSSDTIFYRYLAK